jgi:hypothetical protein
MKTTKFSITVCAIILGVGLLFAEKPTNVNVSDFAKSKLKQLSVDIVLTDSQKILINKKAVEFGTKITKMDSLTYMVFMPQANQEYKMALDSILTNDQKTQLIQKRKARKEEAITEFNKNKIKK